MFGIAALLSLISQVSGTPYIPGGDSPAGTDCSGLASWVANVASGRPAFGSRFNTGNMESALLARGFQYGAAPESVVIGWNGAHAAVTLPDGTPVSSGEYGSGVRVGGSGAYQSGFTHHMFLPVVNQETSEPAPAAPPAEQPVLDEALPQGAPAPVDGPIPVDAGAHAAPAPIDPLAAPVPVPVDDPRQAAPVPFDQELPPVNGFPLAQVDGPPPADPNVPPAV